MIQRDQTNKAHDNQAIRNVYRSAIITILLVGILTPTISKAQSKNTLTFGAGLLTATTTLNTSNTTYHQSITPNVGFFPIDNFAIGIKMENGVAQNPEIPFSLNGFTRLYFGSVKHKVIKFFVEAGGGAAHNKVAERKEQKDINNLFQEQEPINFKGTAYISPGMNIYMGNVVAFEVAPEYRYVAGSTQLNRLGLNVGLRIFLTKKQFTTAFPHEFNKLN